jgi:hypothetical protein
MEQLNQESSLFDLSIDETAKDHLKKIASWAIVIVICAVVGYILNIIKVVQPHRSISESEGFGVTVVKGPKIGGVILGILIGLLINYFLFQFANFTKKGVNGMSQPDLNAGFYNLRIYFMIVGILVIIAVIIFFLAILIVGTGTAIR